MAPPWDTLRAALAGMGEAFGADAADELEAEGDADAATALREAIKGEPRGAGGRAAEAAWARLQTGVGWTISAWRECYVLGQLREATEIGERAADAETKTKTIASTAAREGDAEADEKVEEEEEGREALLRRAMLAIDMAHIMGGPGDVVQQFGRAVEAMVREGQHRCTQKRKLRQNNVEDADAAAPAGDDDDANDEERPFRTAAGTPLLIPDVLPAAVAVTLDPAHTLERAEGLTNREFKRRYFNVDKPVALGNLGGAWPAVSKWRDLRWLRDQHGHRNVPLELGAYDDASNWREEVMLLSRFIDEHLLPGLADELEPPSPAGRGGGGGGGGGKGVAYLAQHQLFEQLPSLLQDFDPPPLCDVAGGLQRVNAWVGTAGTVTPCHFDSYDNLLGQVAGYKFVRLYAASDTPFLYRHAGAWAENRSWPGEKNGGGGGGEGGGEGGGAETRGAGEAGGASDAAAGDGVEMGRPRRDAQGNISQVDVENPDYETFPLFAKAHHMDVILGPGEFIYIPARTWHYVRGLTTSISLNFLF